MPLFCIHKGLPIPAFSTQHLDPADIGRIAKTYPAANFVVYHSGLAWPCWAGVLPFEQRFGAPEHDPRLPARTVLCGAVEQLARSSPL